jgi:hypothetical protein
MPLICTENVIMLVNVSVMLKLFIIQQLLTNCKRTENLGYQDQGYVEDWEVGEIVSAVNIYQRLSCLCLQAKICNICVQNLT